MVSDIKVNTVRLGNDAEKVQGYIKNIKSEVKNLKASVRSLDSMWEGKSSDAFKKRINADIEEINTIIKNIESVYDYEVNAKNKYESCEAKVSELVSGIKV